MTAKEISPGWCSIGVRRWQACSSPSRSPAAAARTPLPDTVPAALTRSLLAKTASTAVYLPRDGVDGPAVFGYRGNSKLIDVTVTKRPDGRFWVTKVAVRNG